MEIKAGKNYYFWDKKTGGIGTITVIKVAKDYLSFRYSERLFKVSFSYADGKLFEYKSDLPGYYTSSFANPPLREWILDYKPLNERPTYAADPDSSVVFGD